MRKIDLVACLFALVLFGCASDADVQGPAEADAVSSPVDAQLPGSDAVAQNPGITFCTMFDATCEDGNVCTEDWCDPKLGCQHEAYNMATPCDDGNVCSLGDMCFGATCMPEYMNGCDDMILCTKDYCSFDKGCQHFVVTKACEDGNICTNDVCTVEKGGCEHISNDASCSDNNGCSNNDTCSEGSCKTFGVVECNDGNICTDDFCSFITGECGISYLYGTPCNDGNKCTTSEACIKGTCGSGLDINCSDDNACTLDSCDPVEGCVYTVKACGDGNEWTFDKCTDGFCANWPLQLLLNANIPYYTAENKPPKNITPAVFIKGMNGVKFQNEEDNWSSYGLGGMLALTLEGMCTAMKTYMPISAIGWNAGYNKFENGWFVEHMMLGGHLIKLQVGVSTSTYTFLHVGDQPTLLPESGTQVYAAGGSPVPQNYVSPGLQKICEDLTAAQKAIDKKK